VDVLGCPPADCLSEVKLSEERVPVDKSLQNGELIFCFATPILLDLTNALCLQRQRRAYDGGRVGRARKLENLRLEPQEIPSGINTTAVTT
jgi:hypothetical protein